MYIQGFISNSVFNSHEVINKLQNQQGFKSWRILQFWQSQYLTWEIFWKIITDQPCVTPDSLVANRQLAFTSRAAKLVFDRATNEKETSITHGSSVRLYLTWENRNKLMYFLNPCSWPAFGLLLAPSLPLPFPSLYTPLCSSLNFTHPSIPEVICSYIFGSNECVGSVPKLKV